VRGELSLVYLRIMRALAVRAGVAFDPIDLTDSRMALPAELQSIAERLQAYAMQQPFTPLSIAEQTLLRRHYIHLSAHWNASVGNPQSALEVIFVNRPADGLRRDKYQND
jgi:type VI secretion system secreted protein VgrG